MTKDQKQLFNRNSVTLRREIFWFIDVRTFRLAPYCETERKFASFDEIPVPALDAKESPYAEMVLKEKLNNDERLILIMALITFLEP